MFGSYSVLPWLGIYSRRADDYSCEVTGVCVRFNIHEDVT